MNDDDRTRLAKRRGPMMLGPIERQRCVTHPKRWESYRWKWRAESTPEDGDVEVVRGCGDCLNENA